jgi:hypothetical protein
LERNCGALQKFSVPVYFSAVSLDCCSGRASGLCAAGEGFSGSPFAIAPESRGLKFDTKPLASRPLHSINFPSLFPAHAASAQKNSNDNKYFSQVWPHCQAERRIGWKICAQSGARRRITPRGINRSSKGPFPVVEEKP